MFVLSGYNKKKRRKKYDNCFWLCIGYTFWLIDYVIGIAQLLIYILCRRNEFNLYDIINHEFCWICLCSVCSITQWIRALFNVIFRVSWSHANSVCFPSQIRFGKMRSEFHVNRFFSKSLTQLIKIHETYIYSESVCACVYVYDLDIQMKIMCVSIKNVRSKLIRFKY